MAPLAVLAILASAWAQDDDDENRDVARLVSLLAPEGLSGKVAELGKTEAGREALSEALDLVVSWKTRGFERDMDSHYESHLFEIDAEGGLKLRADRRVDIDALTGKLVEAQRLFEDFRKAAEALSAEIGETTEIDKRLKALWKDADYLAARFHGFAGDALSDDEGTPAAKIEEFFKEIREEQYTRKETGLTAKAYAVGDVVLMAPEDVDKEKAQYLEELAEARGFFQDVAERASEAWVADLFGKPLATHLLEEHQGRLQEEWTAAARAKAVEAFARRYLVPAGDKHAWKPERSARAEEILRRAAEIAREQEAGADKDNE
jgi:hypothetical protein